MKYDVIIVGGGLSGLTAGSLLSKRDLSVAVIDKSYTPGGACGIFKRGDFTFDQGSAMLYGFGEKGFNSHRFLFNVLEEPIDVIKHDMLYRVNFDGYKVNFYNDLDKFIDELSKVFPKDRENIKRFYKDMGKLYHDVLVETPSYTTPDEMNKEEALSSVLKHPISYIKFLSMLNKSAKSLLEKYFKNPEIYNFFDKMTSTYCYATVEEAPAIYGSVMFVDNHVGGSYYTAGSTLFLPGKLEKVIEENNGDMYLEEEVVSIIFDKEKPIGVKMRSGKELFGDNIIYSGNVWNLYGNLIDKKYTSEERRNWAKDQEPTYPSVVIYTGVKKDIIPDDTQPIEMLVGDKEKIDESEVTAYIFSIDDKTLAPKDVHLVMAIGPSFKNWDNLSKEEYKKEKAIEEKRLLDILEKRFPGFKENLLYSEVATPKTLERYNMKYKGSVAGPKQMLGQHMLKRQHIRTDFENLFCCGESTVMGTGTPAVTVSGIAAANGVLEKYNKSIFVYKENMKNYVNYLEKPVTEDILFSRYEKREKDIVKKAMRCRYCERPTCTTRKNLNISGIMRRVAVGNFYGAFREMKKYDFCESDLETFEKNCILSLEGKKPVEIRKVFRYLKDKFYE